MAFVENMGGEKKYRKLELVWFHEMLKDGTFKNKSKN